ncbi:uncharacterized protein LOC129769750 [Toxorhynchites rutilus septentrionalis]|uniref:uncharacterized protein LOC129769750 n=1 Tax=Toxorhynchites rutilus septentrionalis TaxID=329112 RepID=UPI00247A50E0|nr:uncharacterized protein LOC129769750 [Toxorhynchites rutilus septentrionalis]XP_055628177.1 uncharacterized protein LOC129769750 [Toxorhynchites rutilus septentrionalis]XP_055628178.1 uncharacterized protein LOC129769750 [Toxorhynchites rutilus septentrionalis]
MVYGVHNNAQFQEGYTAHHSYHICSNSSQVDDDLHNTVKRFFALDSIGITKPDKLIISNEDERAWSMMRSIITLENGHYKTGLLWKFDDVRLPDSKSMALRRWQCLERRMTRELELGATLRAKMEDYLRKGYARKLTTEELRQPYDRIWYLPIFPVFNPNKPGKLRIVWDAAAAVNSISLNSVLMTGPDQLTELPAVLYKFRQYPVAIGGDVREMFHQIQMNEVDQHCHRFYFSIDKDQKEPDVYILLVMSFGATCSPSLAQFVKNENAERFRRRFPTAVDVIIKSHYVDDMYTSVPTKEEAIVLAKQVKEIHSRAGFEMTNWVSNSPDVLVALDASNVPEKNLNTTIEVANEKVLGMWWSTESDVFTYKLFLQRNKDILSGTRRPTKRELLRTMMSVYDPLGLIAHYLMFLKMILQEVWRSGVNWDDCIAEREWEIWKIWLQFLPSFESLRIPRCYRLKTSVNYSVQLHTFVDASENGYAAVCYFRFE